MVSKSELLRFWGGSRVVRLSGNPTVPRYTHLRPWSIAWGAADMNTAAWARSDRFGGRLFWVALAALFIMGIWSLRLLPFYDGFWGLDLHNIYTFQNCPDAHRLGIYVPSGDACGDVFDRAFRYPPLLFYVFSWVRLVGFGVATRLWVGASIVMMAWVGAIWAGGDSRVATNRRRVVLGLFWLALLTQFPFVFQIERANNDVLPVLLWTLAAWFFTERRFGFAGFSIAVGAVAKVYPAVGLVVLVPGLLRMRRHSIATVLVGGVVGTIAAVVLWPTATIDYVRDIFPATANVQKDVLIYSHPLRGLALPTLIKIVLAASLLGSWAIAAWHRLGDEPMLVFAGALAVSTYMAPISWDYNLITTYPLLLVGMSQALKASRPVRWRFAVALAVLCLMAVLTVV